MNPQNTQAIIFIKNVKPLPSLLPLKVKYIQWVRQLIYIGVVPYTQFLVLLLLMRNYI